MNNIVPRMFLKTSWILAVLGLCCAGSVRRESLETRLCRAQFVFKFKVMSNAENVGCAGSKLRTLVPLTDAYPTTTTTTTATTTTATTTTTTKTTPPPTTTTIPPTTATTTPPPTSTLLPQSTTDKTTLTPSPRPSSAHVRTPASPSTLATTTKQLAANQSDTFPPQRGLMGCHQVKHQSIFIRKNKVFRGKDLLKKIKHVKEWKTIGFQSYIRLDLNFEDELSNGGDYLFIGRQAGKIENQVFMSNPSTVEVWSISLEQKMKNFDFVKHCKRVNSSQYLHSV